MNPTTEQWREALAENIKAVNDSLETWTDPDYVKRTQDSIELLKAAAKSGDQGTIELAAQLGNVQACKQCGYVHYHCRCETNG